MQTALAVRDMIFTTTDVVVGMGMYLITILLLAWGFDARLLLPFAGWLVCYGLVCWYFVPAFKGQARPGRRPRPHDRAHHRRLHQHRHRQALLAHPPRSRFARAPWMPSSSPATRRCGW